MNDSELASALTELLGLQYPPVALSLVDGPPDGVATTDRTVPSSCAFWREAENSVFYAAAEQHFNCPVGSHVMGFDLPARVTEQLGGLVQSMCDAQYLDMAEVERIPTLARPGTSGILYGPLAQFPVDPDVVLLWLTPAQAMVYNEATGAASWTADAATVSGRPGCAALPLAVSGERPTMALGCVGMRTFTDIPADRLLAAIPGGKLAELVDAVRRAVQSNASMSSFYQGMKAQFA